jgi:glycine/D-amino acid oxidase-like deaminating enzyme
MEQAPERGPLHHDLDVDVCVVGAGLAGLTTAREVARRGWSVAVVEAQRTAWNASGRNCGFVVPGFSVGMDRIVSRVGLDHAKALWAASEMGVEYIRTAIQETWMPGVEPIDGWLKVSKIERIEQTLADLKLYGQELGAQVEGWPTERVRSHLHSDHYFHAMHFPRAFHIHPLNYALGLASAAEAAGARIYEGTPALSIDPDGVRKRIVTPKARVRASHIVVACNVHLGRLMPRAAGTLIPIWTYVMVTEPLGVRLLDIVRYRGAVSDSELADNHYRIVDGDRLMWSGRSTTWDRDPRRYVGKLKADLAETFPQLGEFEVEHVWNGVIGSALHRMPQIGELSLGFWMASGFGSHGLNTTAMAGNLLARAIVENDDSWRLFSPYEFVWAGGRLGRAVHQVFYWYDRARERFEAKQMRQREEEVDRMAVTGPRRSHEPTVATNEPEALPAELLAEPVTDVLPADPVMTGAPVPVAPPMTRIADEPLAEELPAAPAGYRAEPAMSVERAEAIIAREQTRLTEIAESAYREELAQFDEREADDRGSRERTG